jgi:hypothetical protein
MGPVADFQMVLQLSRNRHTEEQMIATLKQVEAGRAVEEMKRDEGIEAHQL